MKTILKQIIPPFLINAIRPRSKYGWFGNFPTWYDAKRRCTGYDDNSILLACKNSLLKVKNGTAAYERDSVIFSDIYYSWPLLVGLLSAANETGGTLNVLDFGGSLGSSYYQNRHFIKNCRKYIWNIVEQPNFVDYGKQYFQDSHLKFHHTIEECCTDQKPNVILASSVLQYLENPYELLRKLIEVNALYFIIDRTPFVFDNNDIVLIQKVPPSIYKASYPCWAFSEKKFLEIFKNTYTLISDFDTLDKSNLKNMYFKGFILKRRIAP